MNVGIRQTDVANGVGVKVVKVSDVLEFSVHQDPVDQFLKRCFPFKGIPHKRSEPGRNDDPFLINC